MLQPEEKSLTKEESRYLGRLFLLAGGYASPEELKEAKRVGAAGIQVGSVFALCDESGLREDIKQELRRKSFSGDLQVLASSVASPSGFPFQVVQMEGTLSDPIVYEERKRDCTLGYLVHAYKTERGRIGFRCPAEPITAYVRKGGEVEHAEGRVCLCEGLAAAVGHAPDKPSIVTLGKDLSFAPNVMSNPDDTYSAEDVIKFIFPGFPLRS